MMVMMQHRNSFASYKGQWQKNIELAHAGAGLQIPVSCIFVVVVVVYKYVKHKN